MHAWQACAFSDDWINPSLRKGHAGLTIKVADFSDAYVQHLIASSITCHFINKSSSKHEVFLRSDRSCSGLCSSLPKLSVLSSSKGKESAWTGVNFRFDSCTVATYMGTNYQSIKFPSHLNSNLKDKTTCSISCCAIVFFCYSCRLFQQPAPAQTPIFWTTLPRSVCAYWATNAPFYKSGISTSANVCPTIRALDKKFALENELELFIIKLIIHNKNKVVVGTM